MLNKVKKYIKDNDLLKDDALHLVALSGGADSIALLLVMIRLNYKIHAVHCNFKLRGAESDRDESFCRTTCEQYNIPLHLAHFDTKEYAESHKISIEMAARELRYDYFEQLRKSIGADRIVVAHHRDDRIETLLLNLIRGTGIKGLTSIQPVNGNIVRPLLCVSRKEIEDFLRRNNQNYITDSSNLIDDVQRNKVRLNVLPILKSINSSVSENIAITIENLSECTKILDASVKEMVSKCVCKTNDIVAIDRKKIKEQISPEYVLYIILSSYGFNSFQIRNIYDNIDTQVGKKWFSDTHILAVDRECLIIKAKTQEAIQYTKIPETGTYIIDGHKRLVVSMIENVNSFTPSKERNYVTLDAERIKFPLIYRSIKDGDKFQPYGMKGSKTINDYLTDKKKTYYERKDARVIEDGNETIIWLVGERVSQRVAYGEKTTKILTIKYEEN